MISEVLSLTNPLNESLLNFLNGLLLFLTLSLLRTDLSALLGMLRLLLPDSSEGLEPLVLNFLDTRVVEQPLGEEVDGVVGVGLIHDGHALGDDGTKVAGLEVLSVSDLAYHLIVFDFVLIKNYWRLQADAASLNFLLSSK